jgi:hypothetical protein
MLRTLKSQERDIVVRVTNDVMGCRFNEFEQKTPQDSRRYCWRFVAEGVSSRKFFGDMIPSQVV